MDSGTLKQHRGAFHWTQAQLATVCGVHPNTVAKWECGVQPVPKMLEVLLLLLEFRDNRAVVEKKYLTTP